MQLINLENDVADDEGWGWAGHLSLDKVKVLMMK